VILQKLLVDFRGRLLIAVPQKILSVLNKKFGIKFNGVFNDFFCDGGDGVKQSVTVPIKITIFIANFSQSFKFKICQGFKINQTKITKYMAPSSRIKSN
jgi:hypothetical protein